jgi:hypothetical protein
VPLTPDGHGALVRSCIGTRRAVLAAIEERFSRGDSPLELRLLAEPDTVGMCFALVPRRGLRSVAELNTLTASVWKKLTVDGRDDVRQYDFLVSKTEVEVADYHHVLGPMLGDELLAQAREDDASVMLFRMFFVNPLAQEWTARENGLAELFSEALFARASEALEALDASRRGRRPRRRPARKDVAGGSSELQAALI